MTRGTGSLFQKRHYLDIAEAMHTCKDKPGGWVDVVLSISNKLKADNLTPGRFDADAFNHACEHGTDIWPEAKPGKKFNRKHYQALAKALFYALDKDWDYIVSDLGALFSRDNDYFQAKRFRTACEEGIYAPHVRPGVQGGPAMAYGPPQGDWRWSPHDRRR